MVFSDDLRKYTAYVLFRRIVLISLSFKSVQPVRSQIKDQKQDRT